MVTKIYGTGETHSTTVKANGTNIATQGIGYNGFQLQEMMTFTHQDPSGASVRGTNEIGQTAGGTESEYDPFGQDAGTVNPYLQSPPPEPNENGDPPPPLGGSSGGQRVAYAQDGVPVSRDYFLQQMEHVAGNRFTVLGNTTRLVSKLTYLGATVTYDNGDTVNVGKSGVVLEGGETINRYWEVSDNWAINWAIISWEQRGTGKQDERKVFPTEDYLSLLKRFKKSLKKECLDVLEAAAKEAGLKSMDEFFNQLKFHNMTKPGMLDQKGLYSDPNKTWNDVVRAEGLDEPRGATTPGTDNVLIFEGYYESWDGISFKSNGSKEVKTYFASRKGELLFHEFLHTYFEQNHVDLLTTLDIPPPLMIFGKSESKENKRKRRNLASSDALNNWLKSCTTWTKSN